MAISTIAAIVAGGALVVAGAAKLARPGWTRDAAALGVPDVAARPVPAVELIVGAALAAGVARRVTAVLAAVLLAAFTAVLVRELARGRRPVCACFGALSRRPLTWWAVVRNVVLTVCALAAIR